MPGYVIHLAIGQEYMKNNEIKNKEEFLKGIISPDLIGGDKETSHYGDSSRNSGFDKFLEKNSLDSDYNKGYFIHLLTDYLFYNKFLERFSKEIYSDYDKLNKALIEKYNVNIPLEIKEKIAFKEGKTELMNEKGICRFIDTVSKMSLEECKSLKKSDFEITI